MRSEREEKEEEEEEEKKREGGKGGREKGQSAIINLHSKGFEAGTSQFFSGKKTLFLSLLFPLFCIARR